MKNGLRRSGIDIIGEVPWGTHLCQFYRTKQDLIEILVPYFKQGLENNEFCMWITSNPLIRFRTVSIYWRYCFSVISKYFITVRLFNPVMRIMSDLLKPRFLKFCIL
ncbi:MAG: MEDS domain-containing protein [Elusimicrobiota bacterium]